MLGGCNWAAVIGDPIDHSLSPVLHREAYRILGLDWCYRKIQVTSDQLPEFLRTLDQSCKGLSVTKPLKYLAAAEADVLGSVAKATHVCNTLIPAASVLAGENTDVGGITRALHDADEQLATPRNRAVIFGSGATASSAVLACQELGFGSITVVARNFSGVPGVLSTAAALFIPIDTLLWDHSQSVCRLLAETDLIISTVPDSAMQWDLPRLRSTQTLLDVSYGGCHQFASRFQLMGGRVISPLRMLVHQGMGQIKLMSGHEVPFAPLYEAVRRAAGSDDLGW